MSLTLSPLRDVVIILGPFSSFRVYVTVLVDGGLAPSFLKWFTGL